MCFTCCALQCQYLWACKFQTSEKDVIYLSGCCDLETLAQVFYFAAVTGLMGRTRRLKHAKQWLVAYQLAVAYQLEPSSCRTCGTQMRLCLAAVGTMTLSYESSIALCMPDPLAGTGSSSATAAWPVILGVCVAAAVVALAAAAGAVLYMRRRRLSGAADAAKGMQAPDARSSAGTATASLPPPPPPGRQSEMGRAASVVLPPDLWRLRCLGPLQDEQARSPGIYPLGGLTECVTLHAGRNLLI